MPHASRAVKKTSKSFQDLPPIRVRREPPTIPEAVAAAQDLADDTRTMQSITVDVDTTTVELEVLSTYPPEGPGPRDMVPIAEVQLIAG